MNTQHIIGTLTPTQPDSVTEHTYRHIYKAVTRHKLYGIVFAENWEEGILTLNNNTPNVVPDECASPLEFINRLIKLLNTDGISELDLKGDITVMVPDINPIVFRLTVTDGTVHYQQANLIWNKKRYFF